MAEYLSLGVEYLGFLNGQLRDLRGYTTLANELVQNADDAPQATEIIFDVRDDALIVENNGIFSDCEHMEQSDCPWYPERGYRCDFHRFRLTASGDKRRQSDTTGAFGIGFIAVYQITDRPEVMSRGRHWVIRPEEATERRIAVQPPLVDMIGTRFRFPWAMGVDSGIRKELGVEPMDSLQIMALLNELERALPSSLLFLRKLLRIELKHNGRAVKEIERIQEGSDVLIEEKDEDGTETKLWHLFYSDFDEDAQRIRSRVGSQVEEKRSSKVMVAIPEADSEGIDIQGLFHAYLPTRHHIGLPVHVNADFFPSSDRKYVLFDQDYQGEWNAAAVQASARAMAEALPDLPDLLGYLGLWKLLDDIRELARDAENRMKESVLESFWQEIGPQIGELPLVYTSKASWRRPSQVRLLQSRNREEPCLPLLEQLDLDIVHPELTPYSNVLRDREVGVRLFSATDLASALKAAGLDRAMPLADAPEWVQSLENRKLLADEIDILLSRPLAQDELKECAIACSIDGWLCPPTDLRRAEQTDHTTFEILELTAVFAADDNPEAILDLVPEFGVADAIDILAASTADDLRAIWSTWPEQYIDLLNWFAERPTQVRSDPENEERLAWLHIWPSGQDLYPLDDLVLPGGFEDPLRLTNVIDSQVVERCGEFLKNVLDASVLTLEAYAVEHIPHAFESEHVVSEQACRQLNAILAENLGRLRDDPLARQALSFCPIVECADGHFRLPKTVYYSSELVNAVLGTEIPLARLPGDHKEAVRELWRWLGVTKVPRPGEIVRRVEKITLEPPDQARRTVVQQIFTQIGLQWEMAFRERHEQFTRLQRLSWLPAKGDTSKWYEPSKVYAAFQEYLFASQAPFLDVPYGQQTSTRDFMRFLGIPVAPDTIQVVRHLLQAAKKKDFGLNPEVYTFLNNNAADPEIASLEDRECLLIKGGGFEKDRYVHPHKVFWSDPRLGRFRFQLSEEFRAFGALLERLGVRDSPGPRDAIEVLLEIGAEYSNKPLDEESYHILMRCWKNLNDSLEAEEMAEDDLSELFSQDVIPDDRRMLNPPKWMYFEDRPGLKEKFQRLEHNVMSRPQGAWQAMEAAGVRPLGQATVTRLVVCAEPMLAGELQGLLRERRHLIERVLAAQKDGDWRKDLLPRLDVYCATRLMLTYTVNAFNRTETTEAEEVLAHFDPESVPESIFFVNGSSVPWSAIARELAYALNPGGEAGQLASGLKEVLRGDSAESAEQELSELGFAPLQTLVDSEVGDSGAVGLGGTGSAEEDVEYEPDSTDGGDLEGDEDQDGTEAPPASGPDDAGGKKKGKTKPPRGPSDSPEDDRKPKKRKKQGRFGTYVYFADDSDDDEGKDGPDIERIRSIDRAGVDRVLAFEREAGRTPKEMPHEHPGYDVESLDEYGQVARIIEVKSTADEWGERGVGLTDTQFKKAQEMGKAYWLYVVERAEQDDAQVHPIQNPANQVNQFVYDEGWRAVSRVDEEMRGLEKPDETAPRRRSILDLKKE